MGFFTVRAESILDPSRRKCSAMGIEPRTSRSLVRLLYQLSYAKSMVASARIQWYSFSFRYNYRSRFGSFDDVPTSDDCSRSLTYLPPLKIRSSPDDSCSSSYHKLGRCDDVAAYYEPNCSSWDAAHRSSWDAARIHVIGAGRVVPTRRYIRHRICEPLREYQS